jgi:hypothetical protein
MVKRLIWRLQGIPLGTARDDVLHFFGAAHRESLLIKTLCSDVEEPKRYMVATVEFEPPSDRPDAAPTFDADLDGELKSSLRLDRNFMGFTPLYNPSADSYDAE